jgi:hypothetical protein
MFPVVTSDDLIQCDSSHTRRREFWCCGRDTACRRSRSHFLGSLPVAAICPEKSKVALFSGIASSDLTGKQCSQNTEQWTYDSYMRSLPGSCTGRKTRSLATLDWIGPGDRRVTRVTARGPPNGYRVA